MPASDSMRVAAYEADGHFRLEERPVDEPGEGEVRVRIEACGICGTDLHYLSRGLMQPGHVPGHEITGRIERLGAGVSGLAEGQPVAVEPIRACGTCRPCREGRDSICRAMQLHGVHLPGGLAERIVVPAVRAHPLAPELDPAVAALTEPVAVAVHGLDRGGFEAEQRVLVIGAGTVGLVSLLTARSLGAKEVLVTARHAHQAERARALGATRVIDERDAGAADLDQLGREHDIDLVVETVGGGAATLVDACAAVRPGGSVSVLGVFMESPAISPFHALLKEVTLAWSNCYHRPPGAAADFARAADVVDREREQLADLVTDRVPLADVDHAFARAADKRAGALKVSVVAA